MNGKDDYLARWIHGLCAIPLLALFLLVGFMTLNGSVYGLWALCKLTFCGFGAFFVFFRLLKYAFTGEGNINSEF